VSLLSRPLKIFLGLTLFSIFGTILSHFTGLDPGPIKPAASIALILSGCWAVWTEAARLTSPKSATQSLGFLFALGGASEIIGLYTGFPFGEYTYTANWFPTVPTPGDKNYPLLLPFAWTMIVGAAALAVAPFKRPILIILATAALATLVDFFMEPVMVKSLNYWSWQSPTHSFEAPYQNAVGWFLVSALGVIPFALSLAKSKQKALTVDAGILTLFGHLWLMLVIGTVSQLNQIPLVGLYFITFVFATASMAIGLVRQSPTRMSTKQP
jgi:putative membrane protein